MTHIHSTNSR